MASSDVARKNRYKIEITNVPSGMVFTERMALMCESIEFPGQNMMSSPDMMRYGPPRESVTGVSYASITAAFICSPDMREKKFFQDWQELVMDMGTWEPKYYKDYIGGTKIYQLDRADNATYVVELFEVYPKTITAQDLSYATADAYHTIAVELMFHKWKWVNKADRLGPPDFGKAFSDSVKERAIDAVKEWKKPTSATDSVKGRSD